MSVVINLRIILWQKTHAENNKNKVLKMVKMNSLSSISYTLYEEFRKITRKKYKRFITHNGFSRYSIKLWLLFHYNTFVIMFFKNFC